MARKFKADIRRDVTCGSCSTPYFYFQALEVDEYDSSKFDAKVQDAIANGVGVAPCPRCGHMNDEMRKAHRKSLVTHIGGLALCAALLVIVFSVWSGGVVVYGLGILAGLGAIGYALMLLAWPFQPMLNKGDSVVEGEEDKASPEAREKLAAWRQHNGIAG
jgi:hypothetical protein